jgi:hypothetical protein
MCRLRTNVRCNCFYELIKDHLAPLWPFMRHFRTHAVTLLFGKSQLCTVHSVHAQWWCRVPNRAACTVLAVLHLARRTQQGHIADR